MIINGKEFEKIASGKASLTLAEKYGFKNITYDELEKLAKQKNKKALAIYKEIGQNLGIGLLNVSYIFDPDAIILGGGFAEVPFYWKTMLKTLHKKDIANRKIKVLKAKLKDDAGLVGASLLDYSH